MTATCGHPRLLVSAWADPVFVISLILGTMESPSGSAVLLVKFPVCLCACVRVGVHMHACVTVCVLLFLQVLMNPLKVEV